MQSINILVLFGTYRGVKDPILTYPRRIEINKGIRELRVSNKQDEVTSILPRLPGLLAQGEVVHQNDHHHVLASRKQVLKEIDRD